MAAEAYSRVSGRFWIDTKGWGERNQNVAMYLLTNRHRTMEGLYYLPLGYLCEDLGLTPKQARDVMAFIEAQGMVAYDHDAQVVFLCKALKHGAPRTKMHVRGAVRRLREVRASCHWPEFVMACESHSSELADGIRKEWPMPFESSSSNSSSSSKPPLAPPRGNVQDERQIFDAWLTATDRTDATVFDDKRRRIIRKALKAYALDDVLDAVRGWRNSPYHCGRNDAGTTYNDLELLLRDAQHIERFRDLERSGPQRPNGKPKKPWDGALAEMLNEKDEAA